MTGRALGAVSHVMSPLRVPTALQDFLAWCIRPVAPTSRLAWYLHYTACPGRHMQASDI